MRDPGDDEVRARLTRRTFLRRTAAVGFALPLLPLVHGRATAAPVTVPGVTVRPRQDWAQGLPPTGPLVGEQVADVRFLLVHHTASPNGYGEAAVPSVLRGFYATHTGPTKGWPDIAYNYLIDRFGTIWEGRAGSLSGPVRPDATGGSQGFAQLCCFIGDHTVEAPTEAARRSMVALLAALADAYAIDTAPGATTTFVSRGSNRWPAGTSVTTSTIAGHRDMSLTACPGDAAYPLVRDLFPAEVTALRAARRTDAPTAEPAVPTPPAAPTPPPRSRLTRASGPQPQGHRPVGDDTDSSVPVVVASGGALAAAAGAALVMRRRWRRPPAREGAPAGQPPSWRLYEGLGTTPELDDTDPYVRAAGMVHGQGDRSTFAVLATADRPSPAVRAALDEGRLAAQEIDRRQAHQPADSGRAAALLLSRSIGAGHAAVRDRAATLHVAVALVLGGTVTVAATDEAMGVVLTSAGVARRPAAGHLPGVPGGPVSWHAATCAEADVAVAVLASAVPTPSPSPRSPEGLIGLCRRLAASPDPARAVANFRYDFYGATGTDAAVLALLHTDALPVSLAADEVAP